MEKIVPIETLTPILVEPSSGSYNSTYFPPRRSARTCTGMGCSSSSDATTHTRPVCSTLCRTVSLANTSSFCCTSPCTLIAPNSPRMSVRPARRTWREMILAARQRSYSRFDSSPVASGWSRSCSMMKRSIVMTDVGDCERAMTRDGEGDRTPLIGAEHGAPLRAITLDRAEEPEISRIRHGLTGLEHIRRVERVEHGRQAAEMIEMRVRGDNRRQLRRAVASEKRHHDASAGIPLRPPRPTINQHPPPGGTAQRNRVALPNV